MNLCKCADLDGANVKPEFAHDLVPGERGVRHLPLD